MNFKKKTKWSNMKKETKAKGNYWTKWSGKVYKRQENDKFYKDEINNNM